MKESWDTLINRARELASERSQTAELLTFYAKLLSAQKEIYEQLRGREDWLPSGDLSRDLSVIRSTLPTLLEVAQASGPAPLAEEARLLGPATETEIDEMLFDYWRAPNDLHFFAKALLQPYARWLAEARGTPIERDIAFLGGLINYAIQNNRIARDYITNFTNAAFIIKEGFKLPEDGLYSGFDAATQVYDKSTWNYQEGELWLRPPHKRLLEPLPRLQPRPAPNRRHLSALRKVRRTGARVRPAGAQAPGAPFFLQCLPRTSLTTPRFNIREAYSNC